MAQHDYNIVDQSGALFLPDLNNVLQAIVTQNAGPAAPSPTYPFMMWPDTTNGLLKMRNAANLTWITLGAFDASSWSQRVRSLVLEEQVDAPSTGAEEVALFGRIIEGQPELVSREELDGDEVVLTKSGSGALFRTIATFTASGGFLVPAHVRRVWVEAWGGGGGGATAGFGGLNGGTSSFGSAISSTGGQGGGQTGGIGGVGGSAVGPFTINGQRGQNSGDGKAAGGDAPRGGGGGLDGTAPSGATPGGGGRGNTNGAGGSGGYASGWVSVTPGANLPITVGTGGGAGGAGAGVGGNGLVVVYW